MSEHTYNTVADLVQSQWESDLPDRVIEALRPLHGKPVTTRLLDKLPGGKDVWTLRREYGMTHLQNRAYRNGNYREGVSLLLYHAEASLPLDVDAVIDKNSAFFSARVARNHARMELRNDRAYLERIASAMNRAERAIAEARAAQAELDALTAYGTIGNPDRYTFERACGLGDVDGRPFINREYKPRPALEPV